MTSSKFKLVSVVVFILSLICFTGFSSKIYTPKYHSKKTREVIEKMIEAHGGMSSWEKAPTVSFTHSYISPYDPADPWTSEEVIEQGKRRVYQYWPLDEAQIIYDGNAFYGVNWQRGNPPKFTAHLAYYFGNIPWLTQDKGVLLGEVRTKKILGDEKEYIVIKMTFTSDAGEAPKDYYDLIIDPETFLLKGYEYIVTYGALLDAMELPKEVEFMGPFLKIIDKYTTVSGLKVPTEMRTTDNSGKDFGKHIYQNWSFSKLFDSSFMSIPKNAILDESSATRK